MGHREKGFTAQGCRGGGRVEGYPDAGQLLSAGRRRHDAPGDVASEKDQRASAGSLIGGSSVHLETQKETHSLTERKTPTA
jgi:hypothetical protein